MKARLTIPGRLPGLNEYTAECRRNPYAGAKMKKQAEEKIAFYIRTNLHGVQFDRPVRISFIWIEKDRRRDMDNIAFAKKFIFDALVREEVLIADSWQGVKGFSDEFEVDKDNPRIEVVISG